MVKLSAVKVDESKSKSGVEFQYVEDFYVTLLPMSSPEYRAEVRRLREEMYPGREALKDNEIQEVTRIAISTTLIVNWRGLENDDGSALLYSPDLALQILDQDAGDFAAWCVMKSSNLDNYRTKQRTEAVKNS